MEFIDYFNREAPVVFVIVMSMIIGYQFLMHRVRRLEKKIDLVMRAVNVKWIEDADRERTRELADHLYAEGKVEEAEKLWASIEPVRSQEKHNAKPNSERLSVPRSRD